MNPPKLPDEAIEQLRQLLDRAESSNWLIGDHVNSVVSECQAWFEKAGFRHARAEIIRQLANATGRDPSTLRDRSAMANFYSPTVRQEFDALSWSQMRACKSAGDNWREYAEWTADNLPAPVLVIRNRIKNNGDNIPAWVNRWERLLQLAELLSRDPGAPEEVQRVGDWVLNQRVELNGS